MKITRKELIKKYIDFFKSKQHKEIPNASLIPINDPTTLFIGSGMETIIPYLLGQKHPLGKRLTNVQKCVRTQDIDEVGDSYHHTFFEMLGNWSLGDYFKEEAIEMTFEFVNKVLNVPIERLAASCFKGNKSIPKDTESGQTYIELGFPKERIAFLDEKSNLWGPVGSTGPCGPNTEIFYWKPNDIPAPKKFNPDDERWLEIGNNVLMTYNKNKKGDYEKLKQKSIDFGGGMERTIVTLNNLEDNYLTDCWQPIIKEVEKISGKTYNSSNDITKAIRIISDHIKAATMIIADGISPSNTEQGYVVRRLIRRALRYLRKLDVDLLEIDATVEIAKKVIETYEDYSHLKKDKERIFKELKAEEDKFQKTLDKGLREFQKMIDKDQQITAVEAFLLYQSYGFPIEMISELAKEKKVPIDEKGFNKELKKHQELSRTASAGKFKSGLADDTQETTKLHTATHLLNQALRETLSKDITQKGSNINPERLRFDFNFPRKLEDQEKEKIQSWINKIIKQDLEIEKQELPLKQAIQEGAQAEFGAKYPDIVTVYTIKDKKGSIISKEICTGPHVKNTSELGEFKIKKEESSAAGIRRIKAILN
jgi:alanyl-tRNA synthetase